MRHDEQRLNRASVEVRPACQSDERIVYRWRNLPQIIALGASHRAVRWVEHRQWFANTLEGEKRLLLIVVVEGEPVGMIRYDLVGSTTAEISIYLMHDYVGMGLGTTAYHKSIPPLRSWRSITHVTAQVLCSNHRSLVYFHRVGFMEDAVQRTSDMITLGFEMANLQ